jgi:hypothetical protein
VYVDVRELANPALLRQTLAQAGVPAIVTFGEWCTGPSGGDTDNLQQVLGKTGGGGEPKLTIEPAAIPAGSELSIGIVSTPKGGSGGLDTNFGLVKEGSRLTCGQPPADPGAAKGKGVPTNPGASPRGSRLGTTKPAQTKPAS